MELWKELLQEPPVEEHPRTDWLALARIFAAFYRTGLVDERYRVQFRWCEWRETWFVEAVPANSPPLVDRGLSWK